MLPLDMIAVLVPATWSVPGASPVPTSPNKGFTEGRLEAVPADVAELMSAGAKLPGSLFEAEGDNGAGGGVGVRVGVYDTGEGDAMSIVRESAARLTPNAAISPTSIFGRDAVRTVLRWDEGPVEGRSVVCDYWGPIGRTRTTFVLLRFWRTGAASPDEDEVFDDVAGSFLASGGALFNGAARLAMGRKLLPPDSTEVPEAGRLRYAGWRLSTVFLSKMLPAKEASFATEAFRPQDGLLFLAVFFPWIAATLALVGVGPILLLGSVTALGAFQQLRSRGSKAVVTLAIFLALLLAFGVATS